MSSSRFLRVLAVFAIVFGLVTVISGGRTLLDPQVRAAAEPVVPFVLDFNTIAGFGYIAAGLGLWAAKRWSAWLALGLAASTLLVFAAFGVHVALGGAFARRTLFAMLFRSVAWCVLAFVSCRELGCRPDRVRADARPPGSLVGAMTNGTRSSGGLRTLRFRVRPGLDTPFTRLNVIVVEVGVVADASGYATLVELVRHGEGAGAGTRVLWHVNPSKRQVASLPQTEAEKLLGESPFRVRYTRSSLVVGGHAMELLEFGHPIDAGQFILIEARVGERVEPPEWAAAEVTHDPSTEVMQIVLDAYRETREDGEPPS